MTLYRRTFLCGGLSVVFPAWKVFALEHQQRNGAGIRPPDPAGPIQVITRDGHDASLRGPVIRDRGQHFHRCLEQLCDVATGLREEIGADDDEVLSAAIYKKTQLLERLAKQLKGLAKG